MDSAHTKFCQREFWDPWEESTLYYHLSCWVPLMENECLLVSQFMEMFILEAIITPAFSVTSLYPAEKVGSCVNQNTRFSQIHLWQMWKDLWKIILKTLCGSVSKKSVSFYKGNDKCYELNFMHKFCSCHLYLRVKLDMDLASACVSFCYSTHCKEKGETYHCITNHCATRGCRVGYYFCQSSPGVLLLEIAITIWKKQKQQYDILFQLFTNRQQVCLLFRWWSCENLGFLSMCWREDIKR